MGTVVEHAGTPLTPGMYEVKDKVRLGLTEELRSSVKKLSNSSYCGEDIHTNIRTKVLTSLVILKVSFMRVEKALSAKSLSTLAVQRSFQSSSKMSLQARAGVCRIPLANCVQEAKLLGGAVRIVLPEKRLLTLFSSSCMVSTRLVIPITAIPRLLEFARQF
jgi:hypothetical protein